MNYPEQVIIKTDKGVFHLKISPEKNRHTQIIESYFIGLGSKNNKCVQLSVPSIESTIKTGTLSWVKAEDDCSLEQYIKKGLAHHMVLLGITLARDINPFLEKINLDDMSTFTCDLPDTKSYKIQMKAFHIAFHGATWYEYYFSAKLLVDYDKYSKLKMNLYDIDKKPEGFKFNNVQLQEELEPLYKNSKTWAEFFELIDKKYGKKKCGVVYPWLLLAFYIIFENNSIFENVKWYINLNNNVKITSVPFKSYEFKQTAGKTRKKSRYIHTPYFFYLIDIDEVGKMNYSKFLHN
jgi:hypothetical protein